MFGKALSIVFFLALLAVIIAIAGGLWFSAFYNNEGPLTAEKTVIIERGSSTRAIAAQLAQEGVVGDELSFYAAARIKGRSAPLLAGEYKFAPGISPREILEKLAKGSVVVRKVTIAEGLPVHQIRSLIENAEGLTGSLPDEIPEGSLLPDTYHFALGDSRAGLVEKMQKAMQEYLDKAWAERDEGLPFTSPREALILASIVEKETGVPDERGRIASVFINRLRKGIRLQTDPTVIYGVTGGTYIQEKKLSKADLADESNPYNTYVIPGLPPGPIANPGREAIDAVMHPDDTDYIFFVSDGEGAHRFSETLDDHNENVKELRKVQKEQKEEAKKAARAEAEADAEKKAGEQKAAPTTPGGSPAASPSQPAPPL